MGQNGCKWKESTPYRRKEAKGRSFAGQESDPWLEVTWCSRDWLEALPEPFEDDPDWVKPVAGSVEEGPANQSFP